MIDLHRPVVEGYLTKLVGKEGFRILEQAPDYEIVDEQLAERSGVDINTVRRTLFILYENHFATYRRERDNDSGWLTYYWQIDFSNVGDILNAELNKFHDILEKRLKHEQNNMFYACVNKCGRYDFDFATDYEFICPVCAMQLVFDDNTHIIEQLSTRISEMDNNINT